MKNIFVAFFFITLFFSLRAQSDSVLTIEKSKLTQLPEAAFSGKIIELYAAKNKLKSIDCRITNNQNLEVLDFAKNKIDSLPLCLQKLKKLRVLKMGMNQLTEIPAWVSEFEQLEVLDIWGNLLIDLPEELTELKELEFLDLRLNHISAEQQAFFRQYLPNTKIHFSSSCNCY